MKHEYSTTRDLIPMIDIRAVTEGKDGYHTRYTNLCHLGKDAGCSLPWVFQQYADNLIRLGLAESPPGTFLNDPNEYQRLESDNTVLEALAAISKQNPLQKGELNKRLFKLTVLGRRFMDACVGDGPN